MPATEHVPDEHGRCQKDGLIWPSKDEQAQRELIGDYVTDPTTLLGYLTQHIVHAARREPTRDWRDIAEQYIRWLDGWLIVRYPPHRPFEGVVYGSNSRWPR